MSNAGLSGYLELGGGRLDSSASLFSSHIDCFFKQVSLTSLRISCCCDVAAFAGVLVQVVGFRDEPKSSTQERV